MAVVIRGSIACGLMATLSRPSIAAGSDDPVRRGGRVAGARPPGTDADRPVLPDLRQRVDGRRGDASDAGRQPHGGRMVERRFDIGGPEARQQASEQAASPVGTLGRGGRVDADAAPGRDDGRRARRRADLDRPRQPLAERRADPGLGLGPGQAADVDAADPDAGDDLVAGRQVQAQRKRGREDRHGGDAETLTPHGPSLARAARQA
jgi:hypothetical protein